MPWCYLEEWTPQVLLRAFHHKLSLKTGLSGEEIKLLMIDLLMKVIKTKCLSFFLACSLVGRDVRVEHLPGKASSHPGGRLSGFSSSSYWINPSHRESADGVLRRLPPLRPHTPVAD